MRGAAEPGSALLDTWRWRSEWSSIHRAEARPTSHPPQVQRRPRCAPPHPPAPRLCPLLAETLPSPPPAPPGSAFVWPEPPDFWPRVLTWTERRHCSSRKCRSPDTPPSASLLRASPCPCAPGRCGARSRGASLPTFSAPSVESPPSCFVLPPFPSVFSVLRLLLGPKLRRTSCSALGVPSSPPLAGASRPAPLAVRPERLPCGNRQKTAAPAYLSLSYGAGE